MLKRFWKGLQRWFYSQGSSKHFFDFTDKLLGFFYWSTLLLMAVGLIWGLFWAPRDYQQGDSFRIIYLHVPAASVALSAYAFMALCSVIHLVWKIKIANVLVISTAPVGALFTFIALVTGAIWGKPTWGTWWVWDARLTSMLVLLFLYLGAIALRHSIPRAELGAQATSWLVVAGIVNLPIIKYSVNWWNTLHQPATFSITEKPAMPADMWLPLLIMLLATYLFCALIVMLRARTVILSREGTRHWVQKWLKQGKCVP